MTRILTATSLFDGHDASINIMRRILQEKGAEVIHLGHNRSVEEVVRAALQECVQGICISSYQGGHMEYFKYMKDLLVEAGAPYIKIFGGGGGVILPEEKRNLEEYGITQIFHPEDGRRLGLEGMIDFIMRACDFDPLPEAEKLKSKTASESLPQRDLGLFVSSLEAGGSWELQGFQNTHGRPPVIGVTGTGGAGKSSLVDEITQRLLNAFPGIHIGIFCVDPTKRKTGGALLGDRIRMNALQREGVFMRSMASRGSGTEISKALPMVLDKMKKLNFDILIAESSGIGQASSSILEVSDLSLYVMTSEFGAPTQLEKIDMIDFADLIAINKADHRGSQDALRDVSKQFNRSKKNWNGVAPVYLTQASNFNDQGVNDLFVHLVEILAAKGKGGLWKNSTSESLKSRPGQSKQVILPSHRETYLGEIAQCVRGHHEKTEKVSERLAEREALLRILRQKGDSSLHQRILEIEKELGSEVTGALESFRTLSSDFQKESFKYKVREKEISQDLKSESLSGLRIPRVMAPRLRHEDDIYRFLRKENFPGFFPFTAGVFPLKRPQEEPIRMFAGEGPPERTNKRFHFLSSGSDVIRLSTAFDSVTLYGQDPDQRPDIFGKVGESGVSVCTLEDMKKLYEGFDLCDPATSVSMTINGPAPMVLAFFLNTALDEQLEKKEKELGRALKESEREAVKTETLKSVRGTVQADILKEDQGQNTCIFSTDFALKMMGDIQEYFIQNRVRNFYSVSISGYHIAEAGANPITQLAFTLANAFTYVEYYLHRGFKIDEFAPSLSFFFSNGLDPEYAVIGRVARRIWAIALRDRYGASERSQKLKYHVQTSGRSLHAQEMHFNDIRTTLQAFLALADNCNSLHTNAFDEAVTTPTEASVRQAQAIQMITNREFGLMKNENPQQGSYFIEWLTDQVEEAVLKEFERLSERGGVLGAMETQYQRGRIQEESLYYEQKKHTGELPIVGVNTFVNPRATDFQSIELARASYAEKNVCLDRLKDFQRRHMGSSKKEIEKLKEVALSGGNIFAALMSAARVCSLGQMTQALFEVGGQYRRNI